MAAARRAQIAAECDLARLRAEIEVATQDAISRFEQRTGCAGPRRISCRIGYTHDGEPRVRVKVEMPA